MQAPHTQKGAAVSYIMAGISPGIILGIIAVVAVTYSTNPGGATVAMSAFPLHTVFLDWAAHSLHTVLLDWAAHSLHTVLLDWAAHSLPQFFPTAPAQPSWLAGDGASHSC
jgi:hypothetical protein